MPPSQNPTIRLQLVEDSPSPPRKKFNRSFSPASCITDTRSCPELGGESRCPSPPGQEIDRPTQIRGKSAFTRSYTDLSGDILPTPYGHNSMMKRVVMTGNTNSQKKLEMELHKLSMQQVKRAEELTLKKLNFLEDAFKKSVAVVEGLQRDYKTLGRGTRTGGQELPDLSVRGSLVSSRCSTARVGSSVGSVAGGSPGRLRKASYASPDFKFPRIADASTSPQHSPRTTRANLSLPHNRRLLRTGESMHDIVEHNMVTTIKHVSNHLSASEAEKEPSHSPEASPATWSCTQDERFTRLQDSLVPMWRTTSWEERAKPENGNHTFTGGDRLKRGANGKTSRNPNGPKDNSAQDIKSKDTFGVRVYKL